jgi:hypothetical protein
MKKIKGELEGSLNLGVFKVSVKAHLDKQDSSSSSRLNVSSEVSMAGCKQVKRTDVKSFDEVEKVFISYK